MLEMELPFPIRTLDRRELLPAHSLLTEQVAAEIAAFGRLDAQEVVPFLDYASVRTDIGRFLAVPPYKDIFENRELVLELMNSMGKVELPLPLLKALDYFRRHDFHTYRHTLIVFILSSMLVLEMSPLTDCDERVFMAGPSHDLGKVCVPLHILKKSSPLSTQERKTLDFHPIAGYVLLCFYLGDHRHPAAQVALNHHERRDGSGYPRGLTELSIFEQMVAVCDVYDALLSPRPCRPVPYDNRTALEELTRMAERGELGWGILESLVASNRVGHPSPDEVVVSRDRRGHAPEGNCYGQIAETSEPDQ